MILMPVKYGVPQGSLVFFVCLMGVLNKDMKDDDHCAFYQFRIIVFVGICDFGENQIKFHEQFMQKTKKCKTVHWLFLATVYLINCTLSLFCSVEHIIFLLSWNRFFSICFSVSVMGWASVHKLQSGFRFMILTVHFCLVDITFTKSPQIRYSKI